MTKKRTPKVKTEQQIEALSKISAAISSELYLEDILRLTGPISVPGYDFSMWLGLLAPARTPPAVVSKLNALFVNASRDPNIRKPKLDGNLLVGSSPEEFRQRIVSETDLWRRIVKDTGMKVEAQ